MKLLVVFMLAVIPVCCYAGAGCPELKYMNDAAIDPAVSVEEYVEVMHSYVGFSHLMEAVAKMKKCFLKQSNETLANVKVMMETIYNSENCAKY
ncbi:mammaglobin-A-like [Perognathus longimembris pacificus]|uniref:mammaglobin-A-like n=1 Tax=Perognathus longimembris pacificus TaxID=214514 RepID=UPI00201999AE|nr:mammaglobin-A-like [Perognathus longimembris pacificus]